MKRRRLELATHPVGNPGQWPRLMRAETAAAYVDEVSVEAFRRKVGTAYPYPVSGKGERQKWDKVHLDQAATARGEATDTPDFDAVSVL